jgi:hypothetical protein
MKAFAAAIVLFLGASQLHAEEIQFWLNRFGGIFIETAEGKERVRVFQGNKETENTIFESRLTRAAPGTYATPKGTVFTVKHLKKPIINDRNRRINSGDWQLTVSGKGKEFARLKPRMPFVAFGDLPPFVYLGEKAE